jgi:ubiquinone/menaquinone biosynthesis C-methylase UbiE
MVAFTSLKREAIHRSVRNMYTAVAGSPGAQFHFPTGARACERLGYPREQLEGLPQAAVESFAGVGWPFAANVIRAGDAVLDIGSGSGTDALIAARLAGSRGKVYALDMTPAMREKLRQAARQASAGNVEVLDGDAEAIPLPDATVDVVTSNGVLNLVPDKPRAFAEIFRVLKPGGRLQIADIALATPVAARFKQDPALWAECVVGAVQEERYLEMLRAAGFTAVEPLAHFDYFALSSNSRTREVARLFDAHAVTLRAVKPEQAPARVATGRKRAAARLTTEIAGTAAALFAWFACAGAAPMVAALSALGVGALARHEYMFPAFAALLAFTVWLLWRSAAARGRLGPAWLGLGGGVAAVGLTWLALLGLARIQWWWPHVGVAAVLAASVWNFAAPASEASCVDEMVQAASRPSGRAAARRRIVHAAAAVAALAVLYGMHKSVHASLI